MVTTLKNTENIKQWQERRKIRSLAHCWWDCKVVLAAIKKWSGSSPKKQTELPSAFPLLSIYPKELKVDPYTYPCAIHNSQEAEAS